MIRRNVKIGFLALVATALIGGAIFTNRSAHAWGHKGRAAIMKRMVNAHIDEVLDDAKVNDTQRQTIYQARDRVFTAFENQHGTHRARLEEALQLFEADRLDPNRVQSMRTTRESEMQKLGDVVTQAITDVHDVLTPQQRRVVTDHIRSFRGPSAE